MMSRGIPFLLFGLFLLAPSLRAERPPIEAVYKEALRYAGLDPGEISRWRRRSRKAALFPRLQVGLDRRLRNNLSLDIKDSISLSGGNVTVGPAAQSSESDNNNDVSLEMKAVWYLDQLLFSSGDVEISQEARSLARERERLLQDVRGYYFQRERLLQEKPTSGSAIELAEVNAALDALTGGWFGRRLKQQP